MPAESLAELFRSLALGNVLALDGIYDAMSKDLYGLALWCTGSSADAQDVVQSVFVRLAEAGARLAEVREPRPYLLTMTRRACVDLRRGPAARTVAVTEGTILLHGSNDDPGRRIDAQRVSALLLQLPAPQREAIFLHHFCDLTFAAIGRVTGVPTFTAASRFRNGIRTLRRLMECPR